ncbi:MAG: glutamate synthase [Nitrospirae bacterium]|nr:glutamate synthase [Nitrospirota bacterium]
MCRLSAITSGEYISPMENVLSLETMKEGHDGSGMGLILKDLGGEFESYKKYPILSGICSKSGMKELDNFMSAAGFKSVHSWHPKIKPVTGVKLRDCYFANVYDYPDEFQDKSITVKETLLLDTRLKLRSIGQEDESIIVFSFYPDILTLKEVGDPLQLSEFFGLDTSLLKAKIILAQGRQNTNYAINLYACHPFFIQGYGSMTNGENRAFMPIRDYLTSRGFPGYICYNSDSEGFTHILHYTNKVLGYPLKYYKDVITPLKKEEIEGRPDKDFVMYMKMCLRFLCIDGPNCVIGFTPDGSCFMVQDAKKLRPGVVGGVPGKYALVSEQCGLNSAISERDPSTDIYPMRYDMVIVSPQAKEVRVWNQLQGWTKTMN